MDNPDGSLGKEGPHAKYAALMAACAGLPPVPTAVVHPCDAASLAGALEAAAAGLIVPVLVGPEAAHPPRRRRGRGSTSPAAAWSTRRTAMRSAAKGVRPGPRRRGGGADEGQPAHRRADGRGRRARHGIRTAGASATCSPSTSPTYPRPLFITDAAVNIYPTLDRQARHRPERDRPRARARHRHAAGRDPVGGRDGHRPTSARPSTRPRCARWPIAARSPAASSTARWRSTTPIARRRRASRASFRRSPGDADILVVPDLEAGNMLAKQLDISRRRRRWPASCWARACRSC